MKTNRNERGQALVLIVFAIIGMMGFAAMAIDGGMMYAERRRAQNAADAAAYAAALAGVQGKTAAQIQTLAENVLVANGFTPGSDMVVQVNKGPNSGPYQGNQNYYQVVISMNIKPMFSQFLFSGGIPMKAEAVARGQGGMSGGGSPSSNNAIHGLAKTGNSIRWNGGITTIVMGGDIYGRNIGDKDGTSGNIYMVDYGNIAVSGSWTGSTAGIYKGAASDPNKYLFVPTTNAPVQEDPVIAQPQCPTTAGSVSGDTYSPGLFTSEIKINGNSKVTFNPGVYCLQDGMKWNGNSEVVGDGVLFVVLGGNVTMNGGGKVTLNRASDIKDAANTQYGGLLFYNAGNGEIALLGGNSTKYSGTIYNPKGTCEFGGNSGALGYHSNIICNLVWIHGNATVKIDYKANENYNPAAAPIVDLVQ